jgi:Glycosyl transferase family 2
MSRKEANMQFWCCDRYSISIVDLPMGVAVIAMYDCDKGPMVIKGHLCCVDVLQLCVHNITEPIEGSVMPTIETAREIYSFWLRNKDRASGFYVPDETMCVLGVAVRSVFSELHGVDSKPLLRKGTYNRLLHKLMREAAGLPAPSEPLVSIVVRVCYPVDRLQAFLLSMKRQRYTNWQVIVVTDGPRPDVRGLLAAPSPLVPLAQVKLIETQERKGHWGHPILEAGMAVCDGSIIGLQNDDNYLTPGYIEYLVWALEDGADLALCDTVHSYHGYNVEVSESVVCKCDLGCFLARADLARSVQWPGNWAQADGVYVENIARAAGHSRVAKVNRPLFVHN